MPLGPLTPFGVTPFFRFPFFTAVPPYRRTAVPPYRPAQAGVATAGVTAASFFSPVRIR